MGPIRHYICGGWPREVRDRKEESSSCEVASYLKSALLEEALRGDCVVAEFEEVSIGYSEGRVGCGVWELRDPSCPVLEVEAPLSKDWTPLVLLYSEVVERPARLNKGPSSLVFLLKVGIKHSEDCCRLEAQLVLRNMVSSHSVVCILHVALKNFHDGVVAVNGETRFLIEAETF